MQSKRLTRRNFLRISGAAGAAAALAACAAPAAAPKAEAPAAEAPKAEEAAPAAEAKLSTQLSAPVKFSYLRPVWGPATHQKGADYELELFKRANVEIESQIIPVFDYDTKHAVQVAGGSQPDVMWLSSPTYGPDYDMIQQGAFLALDDLLAKYPDVKGAIADGLWDMLASPDGKHYFFPMPLSNWVPFPIYYRVDVFKELGITEPETIDDLVAALKVIKEKKPDMVPLTAHEYSQWYFQNVAAAFAYNWGWTADPADANPDNPAKIVPGSITPGNKDFLAWLQMLRKEALIDPDYMVAQGMKGVDKFNAGTAAVMVGHWMGLPDWLAELKKNVPEADVSFLKQLKGPNGTMGAFTLSGFDRGFAIASKAKDKADDIFKFLNWVFTEGYDFMTYGVEGKTYTLDAEGNKIGIPDSERETGWKGDNIEPFGFVPKSSDVIPGFRQTWKDIYNIYKARGFEDKMPMVRKMFEDSAANAQQNYNRNTFSATGAKKGGQLSEQYLRPMQEKIIIDPTVSLDTWDEAVKNWLDNGGNDIIKEINEAQKDKSKPKITYVYSGPDYQ
jgi:hypothetical protein